MDGERVLTAPKGTASRLGLLGIPLAVVGGLLLAVRPALIGAISPDMAAGSTTVEYYAITLGAGLAVALLVLLAVRRLAPRENWAYARTGSPTAPTQGMRWLGVREGTSWRRLGTTMLISISVVLTVFLYLGLGDRLTKGFSFALLGIAVAFAVVNAVTEEIVFRLSLVSTLKGVVSDRIIVALGAWIFGAIHVVGVPGGPVGVLLAAFLGWFLTRSVLETRGMFWAVLIHIVQDVIIFGMLLHLA